MNKFYFYTEWTFKATPDDMDSKGPYHSTLITDSPHLNFQWARLERVVVIQFDTEEEMKKFWELKISNT